MDNGMGADCEVPGLSRSLAPVSYIIEDGFSCTGIYGYTVDNYELSIYTMYACIIGPQ